MLDQHIQGFCLEELDKLFLPVVGEKHIGLAVSGGADSLALMLLVKAWLDQRVKGPQVFVYSVEHGLRPQAGNECETVISLAQNMGFEGRHLFWEGKKPLTGVQAAARVARYRVIAKAMDKDRVGILLTGHHMKDQAETVLMRMAHASGIAGLSGMQVFSQVEGVRVFHPLLDVDPENLVQLVRNAGLIAVDDPSNAEEKYERTRWRNMLPDLGALGLTISGLHRFSQRMARANTALDEMGRKLFEAEVKSDQFGVLAFSMDGFLNQPDELCIRVLSQMIYVASGRRDGGKLNQLESLVLQLKNNVFSGVVIGGCGIKIHHKKLIVFREASRIDPMVVFLKPGENMIWDQRFRISNGGGELLRITPGVNLTRRRVEKIGGIEKHFYMSAIHAIPVLKNSKNELLAAGSVLLVDYVECRFLGAM